jgi:hypothetical protein
MLVLGQVRVKKKGIVTVTIRPSAFHLIFALTLAQQSLLTTTQISRIYLGVHWVFDADGGEVVGSVIANKVVTAFM